MPTPPVPTSPMPTQGPNPRRTIAVLTGSRGEWGYLRPVLRRIEAAPDLDYRSIVTHMHLLPEFGLSVREIENDGFRVDERLYMTFAGYTGTTMAKSLGALQLELPSVLERLRPDVLLLAGDRGEQMVGALSALHLQIPVAHIQAGELSGNVDGIVRHAITKLAHLHFAANEDFARRVARMGEQDFRIHVTGAPLVDELVAGDFADVEELEKRYRIAPGPLLLVVQHPVTEEEADAGRQVTATLEALFEVGWPAVVIYPNADAGSEAIRGRWTAAMQPSLRLFRNLPRRDYLGLLRRATVMVGNSSSGIMEAPSFGTPVVNIGRRQHRRPRAGNVIDVPHERSAIVEAIRRAASEPFRRQARRATNPYGDGRAAERIVEILRRTPLDQRLFDKEMAY